jgi:hypothetical protein
MIHNDSVTRKYYQYVFEMYYHKRSDSIRSTDFLGSLKKPGDLLHGGDGILSAFSRYGSRACGAGEANGLYYGSSPIADCSCSVSGLRVSPQLLERHHEAVWIGGCKQHEGSQDSSSMISPG